MAKSVFIVVQENCLTIPNTRTIKFRPSTYSPGRQPINLRCLLSNTWLFLRGLVFAPGMNAVRID
jgi:hypothetical protein